MPHHRRSKSYQLRNHEIDPLLTYEGIKTNPLPYIDSAIHLPDDHSLCLVELYYEHWDVNVTTEQIFLHDPFLFSNNDNNEEENTYLKNIIHPLKWLYDLIKNDQLQIYYSTKECTLTLHYSLISKRNFNLFIFYKSCKDNEKTNRFFKQLFIFDDYQSISQLNNNDTNAMNIIDFIYQEIQATTMFNIDQNNSLIAVDSFLKNDVIQLKEHQIKSINWMLKREQEYSSTIVYTPLHCCHDLLDKLFYVHIIDGVILHKDEITKYDREQFSISGGILCDEMGLGKTMCVLLTSLLNKCPDDFLIKQVSQSLDDQNLTNFKRFKADDSMDLPCLCGKIIQTQRRNSRSIENSSLICTQCSRYIHRNCFIQDDTDQQQPFLCPYCEQRLPDSNELLSTSATLIVAPGAIIDQWIEEIYKHLDCPLKIYMYEGIVNKIPIPDRRFLAKQDFIFCSYENLRKDIHHNESCSKEQHATRTHVRRYEYLISPLLRLKFWRLVLDEAQMVDTPNAPTSIMARSLVAHHRWFVTGTPFHRSINNLEGIVQYLFPSISIPRDQVSTLLRKKDKINEVFLSWLMNFLKLITRRTSRQCLNDLPEQYERVIRLQFSELERMYYDRIWNECRDEFKREFQHLWQKRERERNGGISLEESVTWTLDSNNEIDMNDIHFLSSTARSCLQTPLIKLRCLCDHPQVGAYGVRHNDPALVHYYNRFHYSSNRNFSIRHSKNLLESTTPLTKDDQPFTMKDLLDLLTARELESGEDCLRLSLLNFNGLASLYLIQYEHEITRSITENNNKNDQYYIQMAIRTYERVIETAETYKETFHADSFQLAHAYYNLSHSITLLTKLDSFNTDYSKFTSSEAWDEFNKIKQRHQTQSEHEMSDAWKKFNEKLLDNKDVRNDIKALLQEISTYVKPIENEKLDIQYHVNRERRLPFTTWNGFLFKLVEEFDKLQRIRENLLIYTEALKRTPNDNEVAKMNTCSKCGLDNDSSNEYICIFCECDPVMKSYNCSLQPELYSEKQINEDDGAYVVYYINEILSKGSMRSHESTRQLAKLLRTDWNDLLKKLRLENTSARAYSQQLKHLYLSLDEMLQCTSRLEYYIGDLKSRPKKHLNRFRFNAEMIEEERRDFDQQAIDYLKKVIKHRHQFNYFQEQQQDYYRSITTTNLLPNQRTKCPMCHELFGDDRPDVCFFLCGHFFCRECTLQWKKHIADQRLNRSRLKCPICRRDIPINSLTVLKWQNQNCTQEKPSIESTPSDNISIPRIRRLIETQEQLTIQGRYGTKVDSIVSFILNLLNDDIQQSTTNVTTTMNNFRPPVKILVFSQFTDILSVLAISLKLNAISHLQFTSTKILQQFRQDPAINVLLMPLGKGANGLNLTEAQHVILVEPQLHRSVELQAIARVRRLGQKFNTYVYRFIINDTAEEVVLADSRTAQTIPVNNQTTTTTTAIRSEHSSTSRAASFADVELLYEINMARKIFVKPLQSTTNETTLNPSLDE